MSKKMQIPIGFIIIIPVIIINQFVKLFTGKGFSFEDLFEDLLLVAIGYVIYLVVAILILMFKFKRNNKQGNS